MFKKSFAFILAGSAVAPYLLSHTSGDHSATPDAPAAEHAPEHAGQSTIHDPTLPGGVGAPGSRSSHPVLTPFRSASKSMPLEGAGVQDLATVLSFGITPHWVLGHWQRVSTGLAELDLQGYRVPLVTGTTDLDVAGSLTYYFNAQQKVQRITFQGTTGDARQLVSVLVTNHGFIRQVVPDARLFLYQCLDGRKVIGELHVKPAPVVNNGDPWRRFEVALVMDRPKDLD